MVDGRDSLISGAEMLAFMSGACSVTEGHRAHVVCGVGHTFEPVADTNSKRKSATVQAVCKANDRPVSPNGSRTTRKCCALSCLLFPATLCASAIVAENKKQPENSFQVACGGDKGIRTPGLCVANASLYQLSHIPKRLYYITTSWKKQLFFINYFPFLEILFSKPAFLRLFFGFSLLICSRPILPYPSFAFAFSRFTAAFSPAAPPKRAPKPAGKKLAAKGLSGLTAPVNLTGKMQSSDYWFNDGYSFYQPCPNEDVFYENAEKYFDYFKTHYDGLFGKTSITKLGTQTDETWYDIVQKTDIDEYYSNNPSKLYKFYYVTNNTLEDGYIVKGSVFTFEIRYEFSTNDNCYLFKLFIESADTNRTGTSRNYYKMK